MKDRYPLLAFWKKEGINEFPDLKKEPALLRDFVGSLLYPSLRDAAEKTVDKMPVSVFSALLSPEQYQLDREARIEELTEKVLDPAIMRIIEKSRSREAEVMCLEKMAVALGKKSRDEARAALVQRMPETRGGKVFGFENHRRLMKFIYHELQKAIREIRLASDIPLASPRRSDTRYPWGKGMTDIAEKCPAALEILDKKELPLIEKGPRISECAILIIKQRLKKFLPPGTSARTLKDQLQK